MEYLMENLDIQNVSIDKIETDIMSILYAFINIKFNENMIINKILVDKYNIIESFQILQDFKSKFLFALLNLKNKYENIKIFKDDDLIWLYLCENINNENLLETFINIKKPLVILDKLDYYHMFNYLYTNDLTNFINWINPTNGNTIFHELVLTKNKLLIEKLLLHDQFIFTYKNKFNETPIEILTSNEILNILSKNLIKKYLSEINYLLSCEKQFKDQIEYKNKYILYLLSLKYQDNIINKTSMYHIINLKLSNYNINYKLYIFSFLFLIFTFIFFKII